MTEISKFMIKFKMCIWKYCNMLKIVLSGSSVNMECTN